MKRDDQAPKSLMKGFALLLALLLGACGGGDSSSEQGTDRHTISGSVSITGNADLVLWGNSEEQARNPEVGVPCVGSGGFSDIQESAPVSLRDEEGKVIGSNRLGEGTLSEVAGASLDADKTCAFRFTLTDVPDAEFYSIEVGSRGEITYSKSDMEENDWMVELSLGD